jgi:hypothetical protein
VEPKTFGGGGVDSPPTPASQRRSQGAPISGHMRQVPLEIRLSKAKWDDGAVQKRELQGVQPREQGK